METSDSLNPFQDHHQKIPKIDLPTFDGTRPTELLRKCEEYFIIHDTSEDQKLSIGVIYLRGYADLWYDVWRLQNQVTNWTIFSAALCKRFDSPVLRDECCEAEAEATKYSVDGEIGHGVCKVFDEMTKPVPIAFPPSYHPSFSLDASLSPVFKDSTWLEEVDHSVPLKLDGVGEEHELFNEMPKQCMLNSFWRSNVSFWLTKGIVSSAYIFMFHHGYITFGLAPSIKEMKLKSFDGNHRENVIDLELCNSEVILLAFDLGGCFLHHMDRGLLDSAIGVSKPTNEEYEVDTFRDIHFASDSGIKYWPNTIRYFQYKSVLHSVAPFGSKLFLSPNIQSDIFIAPSLLISIGMCKSENMSNWWLAEHALGLIIELPFSLFELLVARNGGTKLYTYAMSPQYTILVLVHLMVVLQIFFPWLVYGLLHVYVLRMPQMPLFLKMN